MIQVLARQSALFDNQVVIPIERHRGGRAIDPNGRRFIRQQWRAIAVRRRIPPAEGILEQNIERKFEAHTSACRLRGGLASVDICSGFPQVRSERPHSGTRAFGKSNRTAVDESAHLEQVIIVLMKFGAQFSPSVGTLGLLGSV
jgi:hypothetical protein